LLHDANFSGGVTETERKWNKKGTETEQWCCIIAVENVVDPEGETGSVFVVSAGGQENPIPAEGLPNRGNALAGAKAPGWASQ
jgi:hypothetical protein